MDKYLDSFREMISLRGLTEHTLKSYCTYIRAYLDYLLLQVLSFHPYISLPFSIKHPKMFHGTNSVITSAGFRNPEPFLTAPSTAPFHSCVFLLFMSFINLGMIRSFPCAGLMNSFLMSLQKKKPGSLFLPCLI